MKILGRLAGINLDVQFGGEIAFLLGEGIKLCMGIFDRVLKEEKPALVAGKFFCGFMSILESYMAELTPL